MRVGEIEKIIAENRTVACDGGGGALGHPAVYLTFKEGEKEAVCPYCSRHFILSDKAAASTAH